MYQFVCLTVEEHVIAGWAKFLLKRLISQVLGFKKVPVGLPTEIW